MCMLHLPLLRTLHFICNALNITQTKPCTCICLKRFINKVYSDVLTAP